MTRRQVTPDKNEAIQEVVAVWSWNMSAHFSMEETAMPGYQTDAFLLDTPLSLSWTRILPTHRTIWCTILCHILGPSPNHEPTGLGLAIGGRAPLTPDPNMRIHVAMGTT